MTARKTLGDIQRDLLEAQEWCFADGDRKAMGQAVADITSIMNALEEALDQAWDAPSVDAAKPHLKTAYRIADLGSRLSKRTAELFDAKRQLNKAEAKLAASDPELAELLAGVSRTLQHQINTLP